MSWSRLGSWRGDEWCEHGVNMVPLLVALGWFTGEELLCSHGWTSHLSSRVPTSFYPANGSRSMTETQDLCRDTERVIVTQVQFSGKEAWCCEVRS